MTDRPLIFGEMLHDRFPDGREILGGAPFNVAWHLQGFGAAPLLVSRIGSDRAGERALEAMDAWGLETTAIEIDPERPTGSVVVDLGGGEPRYAIDPDQAYGHIEAALPAATRTPSLLYHGTLALWSSPSRGAWADLRRRFASPVFVDVNLRAPWWNPALAEALLGRATWAKLSLEELDRLAVGGAPPAARAGDLCRRHGLRHVIVTLGDGGAMAVDADGAAVTVAATIPDRIVDTVGAGDAFAAVMILGELAGWGLPIAIARASAVAGAVCGLRGATTVEHRFYEPFLEEWGK
ncbi:MAG: carbohydrate kinase [bacterium]|nr:carbohydrate kinase [bacterium]